MDKRVYQAYVDILKEELVVALGCTEPIAIAYAAAKARQVLDCEPERCKVKCSGNMVKNAMGVVVPRSGGLRGINVAATLGVVGGDPDGVLAVLEKVTPEDQKRTRELLEAGFCTCELVEGVANLYIDVELEGGGRSASVRIEDTHSNITRICRDGREIFRREPPKEDDGREETDKRALLNVKDILEFGEIFALDDLRETLERQVRLNSAISEEGLKNPYGAEVGRVLLGARYACDPPVKLEAKAFAAAGSDARMNGCPLPVVINSGSGNQGITVTMPIKVYADRYNVDHDRFLRAMAIGNLIAIHQKKYIGSLSAYCGAVSAACGAGAAITWMLGRTKLAGGTYEEVSNTITTTISTIGGMVCDGAKASCAAKIAAAVDAALTAYQMSTYDKHFSVGEGMVKETVEETIASIGRMGREGMKSTDIEILNIMLE